MAERVPAAVTAAWTSRGPRRRRPLLRRRRLPLRRRARRRPPHPPRPLPRRSRQALPRRERDRRRRSARTGRSATRSTTPGPARITAAWPSGWTGPSSTDDARADRRAPRSLGVTSAAARPGRRHIGRRSGPSSTSEHRRAVAAGSPGCTRVPSRDGLRARVSALQRKRPGMVPKCKLGIISEAPRAVTLACRTRRGTGAGGLVDRAAPR